MKEGRVISTTEHHPKPTGTAGTAGTAGPAVPILLVEDNPADIRLTREALRGCGITNPMDVVTDGAAALAYLHRDPPYHDSPRPGLVLLDLNLPRLDGAQVLLTVIKTDPDLRTIPVIILTTSAAPTDDQAAYQRHANCYIVKPATFTEFARAINGIGGFWLDLVTLPPAAAAVGT
jgi:CheY-like chemotaxis protein